MAHDTAVIDGLQYCNWSREVFEQMRAGGIDAVHVTATYWENARELLSNIGDWNRRFEAHSDLIMPVETADDIRRARESGKTGIILGLQNCSPIEDDIDMVAILKRLNVHIMQLSYNNQSLVCAGCFEQTDPGISRFGRQVIAEMNRVGMVIDMSHSAEFSTLEAIRLSERPVVVSHANPQFYHDTSRNKSEQVMRALAESGGLMGFSCYPFHLRNVSETAIDEFTEMIARSADVMGVEHLGIGTDLCQDQPVEVLQWMRNGNWSKVMDYGEGSVDRPSWPDPLPWFRSSADFPNIAQGLRDRGFSDGDVDGIMGGNWLRFLDDALQPAA
ncbi:membrane dipeptidase [Halofilum ochraceum]|uniref:membrane dipeptidase n=1 Tax=Halofilum ochraceum TaxID=1611323 RepID=UPI0008D9C1E3|nr:membrane dipeptidase [Halofilum ochraceum]